MYIYHILDIFITMLYWCVVVYRMSNAFVRSEVFL